MTDRSTVQLVIWWLGGLAAILTVGIVAAVLLELSIPDPMWSLVSTLYGALAALLVSVRSGGPAPVQVTNGPDDPVAVEQTEDEPEVPRRPRKRMQPRRPAVVPDPHSDEAAL